MGNLWRSLYVAFWLAWAITFYRWLLTDHSPLRMERGFYALGIIVCVVMLNVGVIVYLHNHNKL